MLDSLKSIFHRIIAAQQVHTVRYLYHHLTLEDRLIGLVGPRGVGKTTLMLQIIKNSFPDLKGVFYCSADHIYFNTNSLYDFVDHLYQHENITTFFIDEIHKYPNWNQELKNLYDGYPQLKIIFSGSSSLDLVKGSYDLSRRARLHILAGLSFREFINFKLDHDMKVIDFEALLHNPIDYHHILSEIPKLKGYFKEYITHGYYPFFLESSDSYYERILRVIEKTIYEDIAGFYKLKTQNLRIFKRILNYLSTIQPGTVSIHNVAKNLSTDDKTIVNYLSILESTGLIRSIYAYAQGNQALRKPEKIFLNNTTLSSAIDSALGQNQSIGLLRELFFLQSLQGAGIPAFYTDKGDYRTKDYCFEIGGKNKSAQQLKAVELPAYLVKDDILFATKYEIPIYLFGFLY